MPPKKAAASAAAAPKKAAAGGNKAVAALKEQIRLQKEEQARRDAELAQLQAQAEAEERAEREAEAKAQADKERRQAQRLAEREQLRAQGKLLSKGEKEKAKNAALYRAQLEAAGIVPLGMIQQTSADGETKKQVKLGSRQRNKKDKSATQEAEAEAEDDVSAATGELSLNDAASRSRKQQLALEAARIQALAQSAAESLHAKTKDEDEAKATQNQWRLEDELRRQQYEQEDERRQQKRDEEDEKLQAEFEEEEKQLAQAPLADEWDSLVDEDEDDQPADDTEATDANGDTTQSDALTALHDKQNQRREELKQKHLAEDAAIQSQRESEDKIRAEQRAIIQKKIDARLATKAAEDARIAAEEAEAEAAASAAAASEQLRRGADLRSPICCILGHVDTGKTKLLDKIRSTNVQGGEAGGITQQIGATFFPTSVIVEKTQRLMTELKSELSIKAPGLLIIDTPGHESFTNLRTRGNNLCDIAILVVDIMHGLEPQTIESINLLKQKRTPFVVALNKIDRCYDWKPDPNAPFQLTLAAQKQQTQLEFEKRAETVVGLLAAQSLNCCLYYKNPDPRKYVSLVPTSAITGEGIPDLLMLITKLTQTMMNDKLSYISELQCTVLEVKVVEGLGTTIDVVLVNGILHEGDTIVVCGLNGPIVTSIRALLTPPPLAELRLKADYVHNKTVKAAMGVKISAQGLENAIAGSQLLVCGPKDDVELLKDEVMKDLASILTKIDKSSEGGVSVQASTLGSLEALLSFLKDMRIPVQGISIGPVHKKDVTKASIQLEKKHPEFAVILAFDVKVTQEAQELADKMGVTIFTAEIIYHLFDQCTAYMSRIKEEKRTATADTAIFPCILSIIPKSVFNAKNPLVIGCRVEEGSARIGTPLCVPTKDNIVLGKITSIEVNHEAQQVAKKGTEAAFKIEQVAGGQTIVFGRHFDESSLLFSKLSRQSIDLLKANFKEDMSQDEWKLVVKLKKVFDIM